MPFYDLKCPDCGTVSEHIMGLEDQWVLVKCPECAHGMTRGDHKDYGGMRVQIQGDTVSGGCDYSGYYDDGLDTYITSKGQRDDEMKKQGLRPYSPDPEMKKHRTEQTYIRKHSNPGDAEAAKAIRTEVRAASVKRRTKQIDNVFDNAVIPTLPET